MSPKQWGPPIWTLFHTLAAKIREDSYQEVGPQLFNMICRICRYLPCPECSEHATQFLGKIRPNGYSSKIELQKMLYVLHSAVNKRKNNPIVGPEILEKYKNVNVVDAYNNFTAVYKTKGNMKLLAESFQRQLIVTEFNKWIKKYIRAFS